MNLIVGLGNPENKYNFTRHNFGFLALDFYAKTHDLTWQPTPKFSARYLRSGDTFFIKPETYYNLSGQAVRSFLSFYKIPLDRLLVVCDDFDLPFGTLRLRAKGSAGGNNGLKSIISELGTSDFPRLRLGTNNDALRRQLGDIDFVLSKFTEAEKSHLPTILRDASTQIDDFLMKK